MVVAVACSSVKGGVLKSSIARALAVEAAKNHLSHMLGDCDLGQGTSVDWAKRRLEADLKPVVTVQSFKTSAQAMRAAEDLDILILDTPGRTSEATLTLAESVDLFVTPTNPALDDLLPAVKLFHKLTKAGIPRKRLVFALTLVLTEAEEAAARAFIADAGYEVLDGSIPSRASLREALNNGKAINETRFPSLNERVDQVLAGIIDRLEI